jgi:6-phosphofructokinase 2
MTEEMGTIVTLTVNPAVDASCRVDYVVSERKLRCAAPRFEPGGGGVNVSRAIRKLGGEAVALFPCGGPSGGLLRELLTVEQVPHRPILIAGSTRENLNVLETATGRQYRFCMPGPTLAEPEWNRCLEVLTTFRPRPEFIVASGSLPPGVPADFYARVAVLARDLSARLVLDTSGEPLRRALEKGVYLVKPSVHEFGELTSESPDESRLSSLGRRLIAGGACEVLVLSLGAGGAFWMTAAESERLAAPAVAVQSSVGAGDSMVAGIVLSLSRGLGLAEAARFGVAAGAAAVMNPGTELCRLEDVGRLSHEVVTVAS